MYVCDVRLCALEFTHTHANFQIEWPELCPREPTDGEEKVAPEAT